MSEEQQSEGFSGEHSSHQQNEPTFTQEDKKAQEITALIDKPWKLLLKGGSLGIKGVKRFFGIVALFAIANTVLFIFAVIKAFGTSAFWGNAIYVLLVLALGIAITAFAGYRAYQIVILDAIRAIYEGVISRLLKAFCDKAVQKTATVMEGKADIKSKKLGKALRINQMIAESFKKLPNILKKPLLLLLNKVPFTEFILAVATDIKSGELDTASEKLHSQVNDFIHENIFSALDTNWVYWLLPLDIVIILAIIFLKIV